MGKKASNPHPLGPKPPPPPPPPMVFLKRLSCLEGRMNELERRLEILRGMMHTTGSGIIRPRVGRSVDWNQK